MKNAVGVLGGVGPLATVYFMDMVISMTDAGSDQEHIDMLVSNHATIPDRTDYILGKSDRSPLDDMMDDAKMLEAAGCSFIVIPCNTAHYFFEDIEKAVAIPVVNIIKETIAEAVSLAAAGATPIDCTVDAAGTLHASEGTASACAADPSADDRREIKLGILATEGTIASGTYRFYAGDGGVRCIAPDSKYQAVVNDIIYGKVKAGRPTTEDDIMPVIEHMREKGCDAVIMGCTELSIVCRDLDLENKCGDVVDSLRVLAERTVTMSGKDLRR